jgi:hypothetical protein
MLLIGMVLVGPALGALALVDPDLPETRRAAVLRTTRFRLAFAGRFFTERLFMEQHYIG